MYENVFTSLVIAPTHASMITLIGTHVGIGWLVHTCGSTMGDTCRYLVIERLAYADRPPRSGLTPHVKVTSVWETRRIGGRVWALAAGTSPRGTGGPGLSAFN